MRKFLLFAVMALLSASVSAQIGASKFGYAQDNRQNAARVEVKKDLQVNETPGTARMVAASRQARPSQWRAFMPFKEQAKQGLSAEALSKKLTLSKKELKTVKSLSNAKKAPRKAVGQVKDTYKGSGIDYYYDGQNQSQTDVQWQMDNGTAAYADGTEVSVFFNVVPTPEEFTDIEGFEDGFFFDYTATDNEVTIPGQLVVSYQGRNGSTYYVGLIAVDETANLLDDGTVKMALGADGSLKLTNTTHLALGVFNTPTISSTSYLGYYTLTLDVEYSFDGQLPSVPEGVSAESIYDAYGYNYNTKADATWTLIQGKRDAENVFVNIIPTPSYVADANPDGIVSPYTVSGKTIYVAPRKIGEYGPYFIYLFSYATDDGSLVLTIGDDGSLQTDPNEMLLAGAFTADAFDPNLGDTWAGQVAYYQKVQYLAHGLTPAPKPEYEPEGLYLFGELSASGYGFQDGHAFLPAYVEQPLTNLTPKKTADAYSWKVAELEYDGSGYIESNVKTGNERDFSFNTGNGLFRPAELTASYQDAVSTPFIWGLNNADAGTEAFVQASVFGPSSNYKFSDGTYPIFSKASYNNNSFTLGRHFATPDVNSNDLQITKLVLYQGKPLAPLYFTGINYLVYDLQNFSGINLKCQIVKATRGEDGYITLGDVIAEAQTSAAEVYEGYQGASINLWLLTWNNFYVTDIFGFTTDVDYLMIDEEFAVVIDGWNNGTFSCIPFVESETLQNAQPSSFFYITGDEEYGEDDLLAYNNDNAHHFLGFIDPIYGYLHTTDNTNIAAPAEGGENTIHVEPMLWSGDEAEPTYILIEKIVENGEELEDLEDLEWITLGLNNEVYTQEEFSFDLKVNVDALPAGVSGRSATLTLMQPGARLVVSVSQGDAQNTGVTVVKQTLPASNGKTFDLAGRQVKPSTKGIVLRDGRKIIVK